MQLPSNCVVPTHVAAEWARTNNGVAQYYGLCGGVRGLIGGFIGSTIRDPAFGGALYDVNNYPELNGGAGLKADLGGNELPNSPRWTANFGAQYTVDFDPDWSATIRGTPIGRRRAGPASTIWRPMTGCATGRKIGRAHV